MENKIKHLEFIQNVISRQAKNSFLLKGWVVTIVAALFAFIPKDDSLKPVLTVYGLIFIFWMLDSYYLWQERLFRALYDHVRKLKEQEIDFDMNVKRFTKEINCSWWDIAISRTLLAFYFSLMIFTIVFFFWK
jgi:hypothetical protein